MHHHFKETINGHTFWMKQIPRGSFDMGDEHGDLWDACSPVQKDIRIDSFHLAELPVTQALWKAVMGQDNNPSFFKGDQRPVEQVSWEDAKTFLEQLNNTEAGKKRHKEDGRLYRLPSEAQWEYAARSGRNNPQERYAGGANLKEVGWFEKNSHGETKPVKQKLVNEFGLYDMSGNVYEWCEDVWVNTLKGIPKNGKSRGGKDEVIRVLRGGSWSNFDDGSRVADRGRVNSDRRLNDLGFRCARY